MTVQAFQGARLFEGHDGQGPVYLAEFSAFPSVPDIGRPRPDGFANGCFLSHDGLLFRQLRTIHKDEGLILTDTPGFLPILISFRQLEPLLIYELPQRRRWVVKPNAEMVHMNLQRASRNGLSTGLFHYFRRDL